MKHIYTAAVGLLLCAGLVSCMKDEQGVMSASTETGYLDLSVAVNASLNVMTRSDVTNVGETTSSVSAAAFPVVITGVTDETYSKTFESYLDLQETDPIELPVGDYTVTAHSNLELETQMTEAYYEGKQALTITKGITSSVTVTCTMKNMRLQLSYNSDFTANFTEWKITITDGVSTLTFTDEDGTNPDAVYWLVADEVSGLTMNFMGLNLDGSTVSETRTLTKPSGYWTGGDALYITMDVVIAAEGTTYGVNGITVSADIAFEDETESVKVPVTITEDSSSSTGNAPVISIPQTIYTLPDDASANAVISITSSATGGLQSVVVSITAGNDGFKEAVETLYLDSGAELIGESEVGSFLEQLEVTLPEAGDEEYNFNLSSFFSLMSPFGATNSTGHVFTIKATDANGTTTSSVSVVIEK